MKLTKKKIWSLIELIMAAYLIISSCAEPVRPDANSEKQLIQKSQPVSNPSFKTISFANTFFINSPWPSSR